MKSEHRVFITEFGAGHFKEITCKILRKSMRGKKVGQVVLVTLNSKWDRAQVLRS